MPYDSNGNFSLAPGYLAVDGQDILSSQHNPPLEDIANGMSELLLRSGAAPMMGDLKMGGFKVTGMADGSADSDPVTFAQFQAAIASLTTPTGKRGEFYLKSAPAGWVPANGRTIGNAASGATNRANADTLALFTSFWNDFDNTMLPIQDSTGSASARGASAAADFAANKRLPVYDDSNLFSRGAGTNGVGVFQDQQIISHGHDVNDPLHHHGWGNLANNRGMTDGATPGYAATSGTAPGILQTTDAATGITIQATGGDETRPINRSVLVCIKL